MEPPLKYWNTVMRSLQPLSFLGRDKLCQSVLTGQVLQHFVHLHGPPLDPLLSVCFLLELQGPELNTGLQVWLDKH